MVKHILPALGISLLVLTVAQVVTVMSDTRRLVAFAEPVELLKGCGDVPEAVELARTLELRAKRIEHYMQDLERKKSEIAQAEASLKQHLATLRAARRDSKVEVNSYTKNVDADVERLVAVYDQMKPDQAATIMTNLPPEFAAEILMRVQPETGARIIASVEPAQAALLTSYMGARRLKRTPQAFGGAGE